MGLPFTDVPIVVQVRHGAGCSDTGQHHCPHYSVRHVLERNSVAVGIEALNEADASPGRHNAHHAHASSWRAGAVRECEQREQAAQM